MSQKLKQLTVNWFIRQLYVHRDMKHLGSLESTQDPNFLPASYLDERTLTYEPIVNFMKSTVVWVNAISQ